ncbi:hypothetical protein K8R66_01485 [bacterium]|nr:hypothetical protein [bacterium]
MKKDKQIEDFDIAFDGYFLEEDPFLHKKAIQHLLKEVDLEDVFDEVLDEEENISNFFLMWERAGKLEKDPIDKKALQRLGESSKKYYKKKEYQKFYKLFHDTIFYSLAKYLNLKSRDDFEGMTDHDLYEKEIIPSEIFHQYFLVEAPVKTKGFDWNRSEEIMKQNLACLITCFEDIYEFFNEIKI